MQTVSDLKTYALYHFKSLIKVKRKFSFGINCSVLLLFGAAFSIIAFTAILFIIIILHIICSCSSCNFFSLFVCLNSRIPWTRSKVECINTLNRITAYTTRLLISYWMLNGPFHQNTTMAWKYGTVDGLIVNKLRSSGTTYRSFWYCETVPLSAMMYKEWCKYKTKPESVFSCSSQSTIFHKISKPT